MRKNIIEVCKKPMIKKILKIFGFEQCERCGKLSGKIELLGDGEGGWYAVCEGCYYHLEETK